MAITNNVSNNEILKFKESTVTSGQPGVVVVNSDGSNVGGGSGGAFPSSTALNTFAIHLTTNTTTTPTASTAYISSIAISTEVVGTTSSVTIQDKSGTPLKLVPSLTTLAVGLTVYNFQTPVKMTSGIDIISAGAVAATIDVFLNYYQ